MQIFFGQIYIKPGISFPFSLHFQRVLGERISSLVSTSVDFEKRYGSEWNIMIRISAKDGIEKNEIRGPTVFRKSKDVEFSVFLPFAVISTKQEPLHSALSFLFSGTYSALEALDLVTSRLRESEHTITQAILSDATMVELR